MKHSSQPTFYNFQILQQFVFLSIMILIKLIAIYICFLKYIKCFMKSIISFEHCFFFKFCYHLTQTKFFLPHLLTLISSVTFLLFFISCNITSNFLATLLLSLIYPFPVSPSSLLLLIKFFGPVKVYIGHLQFQCAFSRCCLMVNIQIF